MLLFLFHFQKTYNLSASIFISFGNVTVIFLFLMSYNSDLSFGPDSPRCLYKPFSRFWDLFTPKLIFHAIEESKQDLWLVSYRLHMVLFLEFCIFVLCFNTFEKSSEPKIVVLSSIFNNFCNVSRVILNAEISGILRNYYLFFKDVWSWRIP